jgi:hypothetical protein
MSFSIGTSGQPSNILTSAVVGKANVRRNDAGESEISGPMITSHRDIEPCLTCSHLTLSLYGQLRPTVTDILGLWTTDGPGALSGVGRTVLADLLLLTEE